MGTHNVPIFHWKLASHNSRVAICHRSLTTDADSLSWQCDTVYKACGQSTVKWPKVDLHSLPQLWVVTYRWWHPPSPSNWGIAEVAPHGGRFVLFWSDARTPHEVTAANAPRCAVTLWYLD